ncbi:MAG: LarC family nickel insertion protein, partial [Gemmatimonadales bacterium]
MSSRRFALLDPVAGISGDMLLGALIDAGAPLGWLEGLPGRLGLTGVTVSVHRVTRGSLAATKVEIVLPDGGVEGPHDLEHGHHHHAHPHGHHSHGPHSAGQGHRHVAELIEIIERASLSPWVSERAVRAFRLLAEAEAACHGVRPEEVALHEVGALDALVDIVGGIEGFEQLGIEQVFHRPVALGSGWIAAAHGRLPVPAPVTLRLLENIPTAPDGPVRGEATTPTGAVLLRVLGSGPPPAGWRPVGV